MKKLMKAIAFATVMCMLLSVSAFAAVETPVLNSDHNLTVKVTADGTEQVALLVLKAGTALADASSSNIYYINQDAAVGGTATFDVALNPTTLSSEKTVDIYAGYASNGTNDAVYVKNVDVLTTKEVSVVLSSITIVPDVDKSTISEIVNAVEKVTKKPEGDIGGLAYATVKFENATNETSVTNVGWEFITGEEKRYVDYAVSGLNVLEGNVQLGVAFANGSTVDENRVQFVTDETTANLYFKVDGKELQAK